jgi:hypothetical protein
LKIDIEFEEEQQPMKRIMNIGLGFVFVLSAFFLTCTAGAQTPSQPKDQSSLGDYARKVKKDTGAPAGKPKVFDNDNLPKDDKLSVVGQPPVAEAKTAKAEDAAAEKPIAPADGKATSEGKVAAQTKPATPEDEKAKKQAEWKGWQDKITAQKDQVTLAGRELDVTQREYQLRAAAMYADAGNRMRNATQWDKEEANYKQQIADKQKALDEAKQKLEDMKEEAHRAGVPSSMTE